LTDGAFPRKWTFYARTIQNGGAVSITVPAVPGVTQVLMGFAALVGCDAGETLTLLAPQVRLSSSGGTWTNLPIGQIWLGVSGGAAVAGESGSASDDDLQLQSAPGESLTVDIDFSDAHTIEWLRISGYSL
jgi:hypothetical protein